MRKHARERIFAGYQPTEHDVFVPVHTKSGTNWVLQIVQQLAYHGKAEFGHIHEVVPWPDAMFPGVIPLSDDRVWQAAPTGLRAIKTSVEAEYVPYSKAAAYITILRDPKEVFLSGYHFLTGMMGLKPYISMEQWLEMFLSDSYVFGDWAEYAAGYWAWRDRPNVLVLHYAELKRDLPQGVRRCAEIMGLGPSEDVLSAVVERSSFAYMKAHGQCFDPPRIPFVPAKERAVMLRGGTEREKHELLTVEQRARIDRTFMRRLERLDCDLPYADLYCLD